MRYGAVLVLSLWFLSFCALVHAQSHEDPPEINVATTFPNNPFNIVKNGEATRVVFTFSQPRGADRAVSVRSLTGAFLDPARQDGHKRRVLRNMTTRVMHDDMLIQIVDGKPLQLPFDVYSEFKPQKLDVEFRAMVSDRSSSNNYNVLLYRGSVTVEEPPQSLWDWQLLSVYGIVFALLGGIGYWIYNAYIVPMLRTKTVPTKRRDAKTTPVAVSSNGKTYDEDWIPESLQNQQQRPRARKNRSRK